MQTPQSKALVDLKTTQTQIHGEGEHFICSSVCSLNSPVNEMACLILYGLSSVLLPCASCGLWFPAVMEGGTTVDSYGLAQMWLLTFLVSDVYLLIGHCMV